MVRQPDQLIFGRRPKASGRTPRPRPDRQTLPPIAFLLTGGQLADRVAADALLDQMATADPIHGLVSRDMDDKPI